MPVSGNSVGDWTTTAQPHVVMPPLPRVRWAMDTIRSVNPLTQMGIQTVVNCGNSVGELSGLEAPVVKLAPVSITMLGTLNVEFDKNNRKTLIYKETSIITELMGYKLRIQIRSIFQFHSWMRLTENKILAQVKGEFTYPDTQNPGPSVSA